MIKLSVLIGYEWTGKEKVRSTDSWEQATRKTKIWTDGSFQKANETDWHTKTTEGWYDHVYIYCLYHSIYVDKNCYARWKLNLSMKTIFECLDVPPQPYLQRTIEMKLTLKVLGKCLVVYDVFTLLDAHWGCKNAFLYWRWVCQSSRLEKVIDWHDILNFSYFNASMFCFRAISSSR